MTKLSRREFLKQAAGATAGSLLAAQGVLPALADAPAQDVVELDYWHSWTEQWEEMTQFVCNSFNEKNTDIVASETVVPGDELITKLLTSVAAGNPPDAITIYSAINIPSLVEQGALVAFNEVATEEELAEAQEWFHPAVLDMGMYNDQTWGYSYWQQTSCLGWNKTVFEEAGLDPEKPPTTLEELDAMAEQLTLEEGDQIVRMGHMPSNHWMWLAAWRGQLYDAENKQVTANDPANVEMFEWMASYSEKYDVTKVQGFEQGLANERAGILDPFISERIAIHEVGGAWKLGDFAKYAEEGFDYGIIPVINPPGVEGAATYSYGDFTVVPMGAKNPEASWRFVKYTGGLGGSLEDYFTVLTWGGRPINVPVTTAVLDYEPFQELVANYPGFQEMIDMFLKGDYVLLPPKMPVGTFYSDRLDSARDKVRLLEQTPQEAMDEVTEVVQQELDDYFASM